MTQESNQQIQSDNARQTTGIATVVQTIITTVSKRFYVLLICLIAFTSTFWRVFEGISRKEGLLGYKYMSSFLYAIGWVAFAIFFSLLFILAARKIEDKSYRRLYTFIAYVGLFIGCYSFAEMLIPKPMLQDWFGRNDFPPFIYYTVLVVSALLGTTVFNQFQRLAIQTEEKLKAIIGRLFDFIIIDTPNKIDQSKINEYQVECIEIVNETAEVL